MSIWAGHQVRRRLVNRSNRHSRPLVRQLTQSRWSRQAGIVKSPSSGDKFRSDNVASYVPFGVVRPRSFETENVKQPSSVRPSNFEEIWRPDNIPLNLDDHTINFNPILLRDLCACPRCIDSSTKQKHFVTADIPSNIQAKIAQSGPEITAIGWDNDIPGYGTDHVTRIPTLVLKQLARYGQIDPRHAQPPRILWDAQVYEQQTLDIDYDSYMHDDSVLLKAVQQLHTHGLLFLNNVPGEEKSVEAIGERIGPLKTTFYGRTWDVRSVPDAKNVAYTAQNLGFHMDLMYMKQPPHIQLLHCIRSSAKGGASLFSDSFKAAAEITETDPYAWEGLTDLNADYHYDHPGSQYYHQSRPIVQQRPNQIGTYLVQTWKEYQKTANKLNKPSFWPKLHPVDFIDHVSWSPPFQAPFSMSGQTTSVACEPGNKCYIVEINKKMNQWHYAAKKFNQLIHKPEAIYERLMKPGECVLFDNRRVLHARRAFEVGDAGAERWLRGAYLDKDPYMSKLKILSDLHHENEREQSEAGSAELYFEQASN